jgi:hypothetical protein
MSEKCLECSYWKRVLHSFAVPRLNSIWNALSGYGERIDQRVETDLMLTGDYQDRVCFVDTWNRDSYCSDILSILTICFNTQIL